MNYVIISSNHKAFWSNEDGWVSLNGATIFTDGERRNVRLPLEGIWVPYEGCEVDTVSDVLAVISHYPSNMRIRLIASSNHSIKSQKITVAIVALNEEGDMTSFGSDDCETHAVGVLIGSLYAK